MIFTCLPSETILFILPLLDLYGTADADNPPNRNIPYAETLAQRFSEPTVKLPQMAKSHLKP